MLAALQKELLNADMAELFVAEFRKELARLAKGGEQMDREADARLRTLDAELGSLSENLLAGVVGPTIATMITPARANETRF